MISPIELGLMIQTTIYFTIVSDPDSFQWTCSANDFVNDACQLCSFSPVAGAPTTEYYYCKASGISPFLDPKEDQMTCGTKKADVTFEPFASGCNPSCYPFSIPDETDPLCACGNVTAGAFSVALVDRDVCQQNFLYLMIALLIILLAWLLRIMLQGTWTYFRFYTESITTKRATGVVTEETISDVYETVTSHWNYKGKYFFFVIDVLCGVGLLIVMILIATTPFAYCSQDKLYTSIALATFALANIITVIPYIVVWRFIEQRILLPLATGMQLTAGAPTATHQQ